MRDVTRISGANGYSISLLIGVVAAIMLYVLREDLNGTGINQTILFEIFGYAAYPIFYGCCIVAILGIGYRFRFKNDYLFIVNDSLMLAGREICHVSAIRNVVQKRNWIGQKEIIIHFGEDGLLRLKSYLLSRPSDDVVQTLKSFTSLRQ